MTNGRGQETHPYKRPEGFARSEYTVNGKTTVVYSAGEGRPVVYWHGGGTVQGIDFARPWTRHFHVIAPYHPGFGDTHEDPGYPAMNDYLLHYLELFEELGLAQFDLVGASLGGWMATEFGVAHPERIRKLVLIAPAGLAVPEHPSTSLASVPRSELLSYLAHDPAVFEPHLPKTEEERAAFKALLAGEGRTAARFVPDGAVRPGLEDWLHRLRMPTLLLWGREDRVLPVGQSDKWMEYLPNARRLVFDDAGHVLTAESPAAVQAVAEFLAE